MLRTANPIVPREPFIVVRMAPATILKYQVDSTGFSRPESIVITSNSPALTGVAIREELETTGSIPSITR